MNKNWGELDYDNIAHDIGATLQEKHGIGVSELDPVDYECEVREFVTRLRRGRSG